MTTGVITSISLLSYDSYMADAKIEKERCREVLAEADKKLHQLDEELAQAKQQHEQALLQQQEHCKQVERRLEVC